MQKRRDFRGDGIEEEGHLGYGNIRREIRGIVVED